MAVSEEIQHCFQGACSLMAGSTGVNEIINRKFSHSGGSCVMIRITKQGTVMERCSKQGSTSALSKELACFQPRKYLGDNKSKIALAQARSCRPFCHVEDREHAMCGQGTGKELKEAQSPVPRL